jgi:hypothetical protein
MEDYEQQLNEAEEKIIAQQKEIEQLKDKFRMLLDTAKLNVADWNKCEEENTKLKEEITILKQYQDIARTNKEHRKRILNDYIKVNQQFTEELYRIKYVLLNQNKDE